MKDLVKTPNLVRARCGVDGCEDTVLAKNGDGLKKALEAHRRSCHPGYVPPPPPALKKLREW